MFTRLRLLGRLRLLLSEGSVLLSMSLSRAVAAVAAVKTEAEQEAEVAIVPLLLGRTPEVDFLLNRRSLLLPEVTT